MKRLCALACLVLAGCDGSRDRLSGSTDKTGTHKIVWCYGVDRYGNACTRTFYADGVAFAVGRVLFVDKESGMECQIGMENVLVFSPTQKAGEKPFEQ